MSWMCIWVYGGAAARWSCNGAGCRAGGAASPRKGRFGSGHFAARAPEKIYTPNLEYTLAAMAEGGTKCFQILSSL